MGEEAFYPHRRSCLAGKNGTRREKKGFGKLYTSSVCSTSLCNPE
jgi:hypothetical protein